MSFFVDALDHEHKNMKIQIDRFPDLCPVCSRHIKPIILAAYLVSEKFKPLSVAFICPVEACSAVFIGTYSINTSPPNHDIAKLSATQLLKYIEEKKFPETIQAISTQFCTIYNQAFQAEENKLDQVCGPGYRKALEFLVKDFLLNYKFKEDKPKHEEVLRTKLGTCINSYIDEKRIKDVAKRAAWLGNDETHYYRKWTDKDVADLKVLISMTVSWIDLLIQSDTYITDMPE